MSVEAFLEKEQGLLVETEPLVIYYHLRAG